MKLTATRLELVSYIIADSHATGYIKEDHEDSATAVASPQPSPNRSLPKHSDVSLAYKTS